MKLIRTMLIKGRLEGLYETKWPNGEPHYIIKKVEE